MVRREIGRSFLLGISVNVILLLGALGQARAGESTRLAYVRGQGAEECPDEKALRLAVAVRLGYDPFVAWAPKTVHAEVVRDGSKLRARIFLADGEGRARGSRELTGPPDECGKLLAAVALAISIAIDPMSLGALPAELRPAPSNGDANHADQDERRGADPMISPNPDGRSPSSGDQRLEPDIRDVERNQRSTPSYQWFGGLGTVLTSGTAPNLAPGIAVSTRVAWDSASLAIEGRYHLPASAESSDVQGSVEARLYLVSLEPCFRYSPLSMCGLATIGSLRAAGDGIARPLTQSALYWGLGARAAVEARMIDRLFFRGHFDLVGNATRTTLAIDGTAVWRAPPLAFAAGIDAVVRFW